ncbi:neuroguidin-like isoform X2 [Histomonas meleagridis]|uniref:neuroguidin-like isoform X2 n=1 Tax=Histomonas meleagridis TaxID=135588 RepID=UPI00355A540B|nr:neuroguidin-like isoform X2 [Histomonas meleagridis]KAH0804177.1 neuroguidin-like isoform X2 [Histomonas meleagridis]
MDDEIELFSGVTIKDTIKHDVKTTEETQIIPKVDYIKIAADQKLDLLTHLRSLQAKMDQANEYFDKIYEKIRNNEEGSIDGISLLQVRNHCLLEYLENLAQFMVAKTTGSDITPAVDSLVSNKCVLEKIKPLENQLQYQLQKYKEIEKNQSMALRANPSSMLADQEYGEDEERFVSSQYQPPQVMSSLYPQAHEDQVKEAKYARTMKAHAKQSMLMDEVAAEINDGPQEAGRKAAASKKMKEFLKRMKEIEEIEEETMHRIPKSKKDRQMMKMLEQKQASLDSILDYEKIRPNRH